MRQNEQFPPSQITYGNTVGRLSTNLLCYSGIGTVLYGAKYCDGSYDANEGCEERITDIRKYIGQGSHLQLSVSAVELGCASCGACYLRASALANTRNQSFADP